MKRVLLDKLIVPHQNNNLTNEAAINKTSVYKENN
jgi:hypothetical protein